MAFKGVTLFYKYYICLNSGWASFRLRIVFLRMVEFVTGKVWNLC